LEKGIHSRGGNSERSIQRVAKGIRDAPNQMCVKDVKRGAAEDIDKSQQSCGSVQTTQTRHQDDHLSLLWAGGMMDHQMLVLVVGSQN
jgi:hypothetical protein